MQWLRRYGLAFALGFVALVAVAAAIFITFDGRDDGDGNDCGSLWSRGDRSDACDEQLDGNAARRIGAGVVAGVGALGAGGLALRERSRQRRAVIETDRLRLQRSQPADALDVGATLDDETLTALRWSAPDRDRVVATIRSGRSTTIWVVREKASERVIGAITAPPNPQQQHAATLGFWMAPAFRGQRLMPEAVRGLVRRLHTEGTTIVDATVPVGNDSAIQALDAAEFRVQRRQGDLIVYRSERRAAR